MWRTNNAFVPVSSNTTRESASLKLQRSGLSIENAPHYYFCFPSYVGATQIEYEQNMPLLRSLNINSDLTVIDMSVLTDLSRPTLVLRQGRPGMCSMAQRGNPALGSSTLLLADLIYMLQAACRARRLPRETQHRHKYTYERPVAVPSSPKVCGCS